MVDREARNKVIEAIRSYMNDELSQSDYDDVLLKVQSQTEDDTAFSVIGILWGLYDDFSNEPIDASEKEWKLYQRIILLLQSDGELKWHNGPNQWSWTNLAAFIASAGCFALWYAQRNTVSWVEIWAISSIVMVASNKFTKDDPSRQALHPFETAADIARLRRPLRSFPRQQYRTELADRRKLQPRHWLRAAYYNLGPWNIPMMVFACFPDSKDRCELILQQEA